MSEHLVQSGTLIPKDNLQIPSFSELKKNLKKDFSNLPNIRVSVLADSSSQLFVQALKGYGFNRGLNLDILEAEINQIDLQVFNHSSDLYKHNPKYIIIFQSTQKLLNHFWNISTGEKSMFSERQIQHAHDIYEVICKHAESKIVYFNFPEYTDSVFGNYANKIDSSFTYQIRKINFELMNLAQKNKNFFICDVAAQSNLYGQNVVHDSKLYVHADMAYSLDFLPVLAKNVLDIMESIEGKFKKCLVIDLDNTIWGGIIGDDGIERIEIGNLGVGKAFTQIQLWAKQLKERGIILVVCSKNDEEIAKEPFMKHPDMVLRLEDVALFIANWENKADNLRYIQSVLNIGFDSMVFLDDSPFERNIVRSSIPEITVPELPEDPSEVFSFLTRANLFETASFSKEDSNRTRQYQEEANRVVMQKSFGCDEAEFLKSLDMVSEVSNFNSFNTPRLAQLSQRSNQFNLRTIRFTEADIHKLMSNDRYLTMSFTLKDKFGDYGLVSMVVLEKRSEQTLFIHTWLMSCRVLKRTMENFTLNSIMRKAKELGFNEIIGQYIPTRKNTMVERHYADLEFHCENDEWKLDINNYKEKVSYITYKS